MRVSVCERERERERKIGEMEREERSRARVIPESKFCFYINSANSVESMKNLHI